MPSTTKIEKGKGKGIPVHAIKAHMESKITPPLILNCDLEVNGLLMG